MPVLVGFAGLAVDVGNLMQRRTSQQRAADAAALAAAEVLYGFGSGTDAISAARDYGAKHGYTAGSGAGCSGEICVHYPPISGNHIGDPEYVEVVIDTTAPTFLIKIVGPGLADITARAVAGIKTVDKPYALMVLDDSLCRAYKQTGSSTLTINNGAAIVNSDCDDPEASYWDGSSITTTEGFDYYKNGDWEIYGGSANVQPKPSPVRAPIDDPLAGLTRPFPCGGSGLAADGPAGCIPISPDSGGTPLSPVLKIVNASGSPTLRPGTYYGGLKIEGGTGTVTFQSGLYVFAGGQPGVCAGGDPCNGFSKKSTGVRLVGNDVTFFSTGDPYATDVTYRDCGPFYIRASSTMDLSAPNAGMDVTPLDDDPIDVGDLNDGAEDIIFWVDDTPDDGSFSCVDTYSPNIQCPPTSFSFEGASGADMHGIIYIPGGNLQVAGGGNMDLGVQLIIKDFCYRGSTPLTINYTGFIPTGVPRVWLAE
jgi:hypothetical protein